MAKKKSNVITNTTKKSNVSGTKSKKGDFYGYHTNSPEAAAIRRQIVKQTDAYNKEHYKKMSAAKKKKM